MCARALAFKLVWVLGVERQETAAVSRRAKNDMRLMSCDRHTTFNILIRMYLLVFPIHSFLYFVSL